MSSWPGTHCVVQASLKYSQHPLVSVTQALGHSHPLLLLAVLLLNDFQIFQLEEVFCLVRDSLTVLPRCLSAPRSGVLTPGVTQGHCCCEEQTGWGVSLLVFWMLGPSCIERRGAQAMETVATTLQC